ncbi:signal peptidase II [Aquihabitans sp. G128]|uniref:signal peptidase II n=1 Tax=Aquihabitans sp. G128 TaxID=2849779 RepID=UPI001C22C17A|nr:signal peptidase II [Aquihabitans sp. G128]QXC60598.1 signal peptidase II [Aquihabitans sp. G128]
MSTNERPLTVDTQPAIRASSGLAGAKRQEPVDPPGGARTSMRPLVALGLVLVAADLGLKWWASAALSDRSMALPGPVDLRLGHNPGVAFGGFDAVPPAVLIGITAALAAAIWLAAWVRYLPQLPAVLVASGATANVIDRLEGGSVVDLFHTGWWPTFNLADVFITVGALLLVTATLRPGAGPGGHDRVNP